jgi:Salmonella virulence-associated 28kDa protein
MMVAKFWFDKNADGAFSAMGHPSLVDAKMKGESRFDIIQLWDIYREKTPVKPWLDGNKAHYIPIPNSFALYIAGSISDIRSALELEMPDRSRHDRSRIVSLDCYGRLAVWFIKREASILICLAGRGAGLENYWNIASGKTLKDAGYPANQWTDVSWRIGTSINLEDLIKDLDYIFSVPSSPVAVPNSDKDVSKLTYDNLYLADSPTGHKLKGRDYVLLGTPEFYIFRRNDKETRLPEWTYNGDKVHVSVRPDRVSLAWDRLMPILFGMPDRLAEFKVTKMDLVRRSRDSSLKAKRIYDGMQITIYFHKVSEEKPQLTLQRFGNILLSIHQTLDDLAIEPGLQDKSDLLLTKYLSYRREFNDLIEKNRTRANEIRAKHEALGSHEDYLLPELYINEDASEYSDHKEKMRESETYRVWKKVLSSLSS